MCDEKQTIKLTLEDSNGNKSTMEYSGSDIFASDVMNMFYSAMLGLTYQESLVLDAMLDFAADKRNTQYVDAKTLQYNTLDGSYLVNGPDYLSIDPDFGKPIITDKTNPLGIKYSSSVTDDTSCLSRNKN